MSNSYTVFKNSSRILLRKLLTVAPGGILKWIVHSTQAAAWTLQLGCIDCGGSSPSSSSCIAYRSFLQISTFASNVGRSSVSICCSWRKLLPTCITSEVVRPLVGNMPIWWWLRWRYNFHTTSGFHEAIFVRPSFRIPSMYMSSLGLLVTAKFSRLSLSPQM